MGYLSIAKSDSFQLMSIRKKITDDEQPLTAEIVGTKGPGGFSQAATREIG